MCRFNFCLTNINSVTISIMKILFYQLDSKYEKWQSWKLGKYFGHPLFGATHFDRYGIKVEMFKDSLKSLADSVKKTLHIDIRLFTHPIAILFGGRNYDAVYGPYPRGLGLLLVFRTLKLFNKPIVIYSHQGMPNPKNPLKRIGIRLAYAGVDRLLFFSQLHFDEALQSGLIAKKKMFKINWGPDMALYDNVIQEAKVISQDYFISSGKAKRDYDTLINAFSQTDIPLRLYVDDAKLESQLAGKNKNIDVRYLPVTSTSPHFIANELTKAIAVTICSQKARGLIGLTNMYEAMALSKPVIITKNKAIDIDVDKEGIGISVDLNDVEGWKKAISFFYSNPGQAQEYGRRGRLLCEQKFNLELFTEEVALILKDLMK